MTASLGVNPSGQRILPALGDSMSSDEWTQRECRLDWREFDQRVELVLGEEAGRDLGRAYGRTITAPAGSQCMVDPSAGVSRPVCPKLIQTQR
jgi:hypothetical protein